MAGTDYQPLSGADYGTMTGTVTIPAGEFSTGILVQAVPSTAFFPRSLTLAVTAGDGYTVGDGVPATVTITHNYYGDIDGFPPDPDNPPQVGPQGAVDLDTAELPDGTTSTGGLLMWRDGRWPGDYSAINVAYAVDPSSTASSSDCESLSGVAAIPAGGWVGPVILQPTNDASLEGDETVNLDFPASHDWPYILDHDFTASFTIHDDEMPGPVAHDDGFAVSADQPTTIPPSGVLCNDDAFSNFPLTAAAGTVTTDQGGTVDLFADGGFTYTPPAALAGGGTDTFSYTAVLADPAGARTATAVVTLTVVKVDLQMAGVDPMHKLDRGGYVPVNANDDSGSPITNEIPAERDFDTFLNADGVPFEDPDLVPIDIVVTPNVGLPGFFVLTSTNSGVGQIKLWIDDTRTNRAEGTYTQLNLPERVYVEGTEPGAALRESEVGLTYMFVTSCGVPIDAGVDRVRVAVTPVVEELTVDASRSKVDFNGDPNNPNAQHTGQFGMILTNNPGPPDPEKPGAEFKAKVVWNGMPQGGSDLVFVQNFTDVVNGAPAGWVMTAQAIQQLQGQPGFKGQQNTIVLTGEPYPILDAPTKNDPVDYRYGFQGPTLNTDVNDVDHVSISAVDRPETGHPLWASGLDTINVTYQFRLYLLVRFSRGGTSVLYPIAYTNWQVVFHADMPGVDGNNNPLGPTRIRGDSGAWPDQGFFRSHAVPELRRVDAQNRSRVGNEAIGPETNPPPQ